MISVNALPSGVELAGYQVSLRPVEKADLNLLRNWRNQDEIRQHMVSQELISEEQQSAWYQKTTRDLTQRHFVIRYRNQSIGSANIRSLAPGCALTEASIIEPGLYIGDAKYRNNIVAFSPTLLLNDYCFYHLNCTKLVAKVMPENTAAINYNVKLGYKIINQDKLVEIELNKIDYEKSSRTLKSLLSRSPKT